MLMAALSIAIAIYAKALGYMSISGAAALAAVILSITTWHRTGDV